MILPGLKRLRTWDCLRFGEPALSRFTLDAARLGVCFWNAVREVCTCPVSQKICGCQGGSDAGEISRISILKCDF
jgi:hypothetical protein